MKLFGIVILLTMVIMAFAISDEEDSHDEDLHISLEERGANLTVARGLAPSTLDECITCICHAETNCIDIGCVRQDGDAWGDSLACGPFKIKYDYWVAGGRQGSGLVRDKDREIRSWQGCAMDQRCAEETIRSYMERHLTFDYLMVYPECEFWAAIHHGGPDGLSKNSYTYWRNSIDFWNRVQQQGCS